MCLDDYRELAKALKTPPMFTDVLPMIVRQDEVELLLRLSEKERSISQLSKVLSAIPFVILYFSNSPLEMSLSMGVLGVMLGAVFVQSSAMVAELSPKGKESLCMAFFDAVIDFSFPVMPGIVTYLVMFGIKTPFLLLISLMMFSGFTFAAIRKQGTDKTQIHANSFS